MNAPSADPAPAAPANAPSSVARNTALLMLAQVVGMPLSMLLNFMMGLKLGPEGIGKFYLASTWAGTAFLFVDWGQGAIVPARIANDRGRAGLYLGSALYWKVAAAPLISLLLAGFCLTQGKTANFLLITALVCITQSIAIISRTCADVVRGFERADVAAYSFAGGQILTALLVVPALFVWGSLVPALVAMAVAATLVLVLVWRSLRPAGVGALSFDSTTARAMISEGTSFLALGLILALQPSIDGFFLDSLASADALGWHAAAKRLVGVIVTPANALASALYPTLSRLWLTDKDEYLKTARGALRASITMTVPLALGTFLFAKLGISLYGKVAFAPAEQNLRILAVFVFLVYVTMVMGICMAASGRARKWTIVQLSFIVVSMSDRWLVPYYQRTVGNGGLGVCIANVVSELVMLIAALFLLPRGLLDRSLLRTGGQALLAGGAMAGVARLLSGVSQWVTAPLAVLAYVVVLYGLGGIEPQYADRLRSFVQRKLRR